MSVKLLTEHDLVCLSLKGGCTGSSESTLVKAPHCWKPHVTAHIHIVGTYCASLVADLFLFCYERDIMSLSDNIQADVI